MIVSNNKYTKHQIYDGIYEYTCDEGYHFESCGTNYGKHIYGLDILDNPYTIEKDINDENDSNNNNDINTN